MGRERLYVRYPDDKKQEVRKNKMRKYKNQGEMSNYDGVSPSIAPHYNVNVFKKVAEIAEDRTYPEPADSNTYSKNSIREIQKFVADQHKKNQERKKLEAESTADKNHTNPRDNMQNNTKKGNYYKNYYNKNYNKVHNDNQNIKSESKANDTQNASVESTKDGR